jgi:ribosomal protein S18 acetylase RimI-like enzyme
MSRALATPLQLTDYSSIIATIAHTLTTQALREVFSMTITRRVFRGVDDMPRILDLIRAMPSSCRHVIDFPWRLSSPSIAEGRDAAYWENGDRQVVGLGAWQYYWATLDFFILPGPDAENIERDLFTWAGKRFLERDTERGRPLPYSVEFREDDQERRRLAEAHGFLLAEYESYVHLQRQLDTIPPVPTLPKGFVLRPLANEEETAAYADLHRAAFTSDSMTPEWRARTLHTPLYQPDLDLVVVAPDGALAGFCVGWYEPSRGVAQVEPVGVHPRYQRMGLARALLTEMLRRFKARGASVAIIETDLDRTPARRTYESVGFKQAHTIWRKEAWATKVV